jgi:hypothetical protein
MRCCPPGRCAESSSHVTSSSTHQPAILNTDPRHTHTPDEHTHFPVYQPGLCVSNWLQHTPVHPYKKLLPQLLPQQQLLSQQDLLPRA